MPASSSMIARAVANGSSPSRAIAACSALTARCRVRPYRTSLANQKPGSPRARKRFVELYVRIAEELEELIDGWGGSPGPIVRQTALVFGNPNLALSRSAAGRSGAGATSRYRDIGAWQPVVVCLCGARGRALYLMGLLPPELALVRDQPIRTGFSFV